MRTFALILLVIDAMAALMLGWLNFYDFPYGSLSAGDVVVTIGIIALMAAGWTLRSQGRHGIASALLLIPAVPTLLFGIMTLVVGLIYAYG